MRLGLGNLISEVLGRPLDDYSHVYKRGKADLLQNFVKQNKLKPSEVISIGDTDEEINIGKQFGYHTVAITGGYNSASRLKKFHPDFLIHNMKDLIPIIKTLNER